MTSEDTQSGSIQEIVIEAIDQPNKIYRPLSYLLIIFTLGTTLFPLYWMIVVSLTPPSKLSQVGLIPTSLHLETYINIFQGIPLQWYIFNSLVIASVTTVIVLFVASLSGYAFGRLDIPASRPLMLLILVISYFPPAVFVLPLFKLFIGAIEIFGFSPPSLYNTYGAVILPTSAFVMPVSIYILTTFYRNIPDGLEDAARIEGSTRLGALFRIIIPLSLPGVATAGVLTFISAYNEFFFSFLMTDGQLSSGSPLVWGILSFRDQYLVEYNLMAGASVIGIIPIFILVFLAQDKILRGLAGGLKG